MADEIEKGLATFEQRSQTEARSLPIIREYILSLDATMELENANAETQRRDDIDLFWTRSHKGEKKTISIEVKVDTQIHKSGNFAFETISNETHFSKGCFMRSKADYFYYFAESTHDLWIFPLAPVRDWFVREMSIRPNRFPDFKTHTRLSGGRVYVARGYLVPISDVERAFGSELRHRQLPRTMPSGAEIKDLLGAQLDATIVEPS